ncbi:MAG: efflux RND transporter periplasmic adaptor subunit [Wenzhouxiangellaceae bacterium]|nr:efflux RND transporter periplasmic adaptor subunit [Wenzhouxiangellaceae bacterium]
MNKNSESTSKSIARFAVSLAAIVAAVAAIALLSACDSPEPSAQSRPERASLPVRAFEVSRRDLEQRIQVAAPVEPLRDIQLAARTEGIIAEVFAEVGDRVRAGQLLARIDVSEQLAELARAQASLREAQATFERLERLRERDYIDEASYVTAQSELDVAESEVRLWETRVAAGEIISPIDGHVIDRMIEPGASIGRLATAFEISNLGELVLRIGVSELDVTEILVGAMVPVSVDALESGPLDGRVRRIFPSADGSSRLVTVEIELPEAFDRGVRPGYLARANLLVDYKNDVLAVPAGSVGMGESKYVMVIDERSELVRRAVTTGVIRGDWREIVGGLEPGDRIVSSNPLDLAEGDAVRVVETVAGEA